MGLMVGRSFFSTNKRRYYSFYSFIKYFF